MMSGNFQLNISEPPPLKHSLQKMIDTISQILDVDFAILRGFGAKELEQNTYFYRKSSQSFFQIESLQETIWRTDSLVVLSHIEPQSVLCPHPTDDPSQRLQAYQRADICATLLVPLHLNQQLIGVLGFHYCHNPHSWQEKEIQLAIMVAEQVVLTISQHRAYAQVRAFAQRETLINIVTAAIRSSLEPQAIFTAITHKLGRALNVDGCALSLWTKNDQFVRCVGLYDRHQFSTQITPLPQSVVPIADNPVLQKLILTCEPVALDDLETYPEMNQFDLPLRSSARALLIVPLIVDHEIIGSISLRQTDSRRFWSDTDIELAKAVASQAAIAVQQSRLYETTKQQAEKLRESEHKVRELNQYLTESVLKRFLPAAIVNRVAAGELVLDLSPETRLVTILFSDIVGFTPLSTQLGPYRVAILLNEYLAMMTQAVFEYGGTVDKFIGDAIFALFGAPESLPPEQQVQKAISVARQMHRYLKRLNQRWQEQELLGGQGPPLIQFRCGIHQGHAVVGMFGGGQRCDYTAIGPAVNMAARLQKAADANTILVSDTVAHYLSPTEINQVKSLRLKGIDDDVLAFSVITE